MKIAIAGFGVEGKSNYEYYRSKHPDAEITIFDQQALKNAPVEAKLVTGDDAFAQIKDFDLVLRSPGIAPDRISQTDHHWSATREFMRQCPAPIIGVTGSKGKGATCSFIASILEAHFANNPNRHIHLVGNIDVPVLDVLPHITEDDIVVYEMSSFQLWDCTQSPHIAVLTMLEPEHLSVYKDLKDYLQAKLNIFYYQHDGDTAVYNHNDAELAELIQHIAVTTRAERLPFPDSKSAHFDEQNLCMGDQVICPIDTVRLPGRHNLMNACAAIAAVWDIVNRDTVSIAKGLGNFNLC